MAESPAFPNLPEGYDLPGSGTIKLSQIKTEFNKGNNLKAYYGVTSGIPSSGTIKVTDFYGKSAGGDPVAPSGNYNSAYITQYQTTDPDNIGAIQFGYQTFWWCAGKGGGNPTKWGDEAGVFGADKQDYPNCSTRKVSVQGQTSSLNNYYPYLKVGPTQGPGDYRDFAGTWSNGRINDMWEVGNAAGGTFSKSFSAFSNKDAADYLWSIMQQGLPFYIAVSNGTKDEPIFEFRSDEVEE